MSAELLREAASLMRERAEAATSSPWKTYAENDNGVIFDQYGTGVRSTASHDIICYSGQVYSRDAEHIASWHPAVALAVADWLDHEAQIADEDAADGYAMGPRYPGLLVARAYLGSAS